MKRYSTILLAVALLAVALAASVHRAQTPPTWITGTYRALITQEGENDPSVIVLVNTTGEEFTWTRRAAGEYRVNGPFGSGRIYYSLPASEEGIANSSYLVRDVSSSFLTVMSISTTTGEGADGILGQITGQGTPIEIRVYAP